MSAIETCINFLAYNDNDLVKEARAELDALVEENKRLSDYASFANATTGTLRDNLRQVDSELSYENKQGAILRASLDAANKAVDEAKIVIEHVLTRSLWLYNEEGAQTLADWLDKYFPDQDAALFTAHPEGKE